jgi:hypothetical protein
LADKHNIKVTTEVAHTTPEPRLAASAGTGPHLLAEGRVAGIGVVIFLQKVERPTGGTPSVRPWLRLRSRIRPRKYILDRPTVLFAVYIFNIIDINIIDAHVQWSVGIRNDVCPTWRWWK